jgi:hypothetical protein
MIMTRLTKMFLAAGFTIGALGGCASDDANPVPASANVCPAWVNDPQDHHSNADSAYLGCANALNLVHMAEDPKDLKHGRDLGPAGGATQAKAVKNYEEDKVKKSPSTEPTQAVFAPVMTSGSGGQ